MRGGRLTDVALATYGSPLRRPVVGWLIVAALAVLLAFAVVQVAGLVESAPPGLRTVLLQALLVAGLWPVVHHW